MLVLSRKVSESITIEPNGSGEPITLTVVRLGRRKVSLGVHAHPTVGVRRNELPSREPKRGKEAQ